MEPKNNLRHLIAMLIMLIPLGYLYVMWPSVPDTVATHFGINGKPDAYGGKTTILWMCVFMYIIGVISYLVVINAHKLDKKRLKGVKPPYFDNIAMGIALFMTIVDLSIVINSIYPDSSTIEKIMMPATGALFIFLGNVMYTIKPNRFVGIRVPWTLNDEDNWKHTHRFGSKLFFVGGVLILMVSLGYNNAVAHIFMMGIILIIAITTILYSYLYHKKNIKA